MTIRGKCSKGFGRLIPGLVLAILFWMGPGTALAADEVAIPMATYESSLNYSHAFPQGWYKLDAANIEAARARIVPADLDSVSLASSPMHFLLTQIDSLRIKSLFLENAENLDAPMLMVHTGPNYKKFNAETQEHVKTRFQELLLPPGSSIRELDTAVIRKGLRKHLLLTARVTMPNAAEERSYRAITINSGRRSYTFTLQGGEADIQRLTPVLETVAASLKDDGRSPTLGFSNLPLWQEILVLFLLSLSITWVLRRLIRQDALMYRRRHHRRGISFLPLFLIVFSFLLAISLLMASCQR